MENWLPIKAGERVRLTLIATKTDLFTRMNNGVSSISYEGVAVNDLIEGDRFKLGMNDYILTTSPIVHAGNGMITTKNSTYSIERVSK